MRKRSKGLPPKFQSTLPVGGATNVGCKFGSLIVISIHAPRGGSDLFFQNITCNISISIHAPRGGSDSKDAQIFCFSLARGKGFL